MPRYRVKAVDASGMRTVTFSEAQSADAVRQLLEERGWTVLRVKPASITRLQRLRLVHIASKHGVVLLEQLGQLLSVQVPLAVALDEVSGLAPPGTLKAAWHSAASEVKQGESLHGALARCDGLLAKRHIAVLAATQTQQDLASALLRISAELTWRAGLLARLKQIGSYPLFTVVLLLAVSVFLLIVLVPSLHPLLSPHKDALPWVTQQLLLLSHGITHGQLTLHRLLPWIGYALIACVALCAVAQVFKPQGVLFKQRCLELWLGSALAQKWLWPFSVAAHARTLQLLIAQQIPLTEAVQLAAPAAGLLGTQASWQQVAHSVERDGSLCQALCGVKVIPTLYTSLVRVGERHGTLEQSLSTVTQAFEQRLNRQIQQLEVWLGPCLLLLVGALMVGIVGWLFVPLYQVITSQAGAL